MLNIKGLMKECTKRELKMMFREHLAIRDFLDDKLYEVNRDVSIIKRAMEYEKNKPHR